MAKAPHNQRRGQLVCVAGGFSNGPSDPYHLVSARMCNPRPLSVAWTSDLLLTNRM